MIVKVGGEHSRRAVCFMGYSLIEIVDRRFTKMLTIYHILGSAPKSTYKALSPSFINNVSTKVFEKTIVDASRDIC